MNLLEKILIGGGIFFSLLSPLKSLAQESADIKPNKIKAGISYNLFSEGYLFEKYKSITLINGGYGKKIYNNLELGLNMSFGTKKEFNAQVPCKLSYFSTNIEAICGAGDDKDVSLYAIISLGLRVLSEQNNEGVKETIDWAIGGNTGLGGQVKISDKLYGFGEIKANIGKVRLYDELISLNRIGFGGGLKIIF